MAGLLPIQEKQKSNAITGESSGLACDNESKIDINNLVKMSTLTQSEKNELMVSPAMVKATLELESFKKPWFDSETAHGCILCMVPLSAIALMTFLHSDNIYPIVFSNNNLWMAILGFFISIICLILLQLMVTCIFICLEIYSKRYYLIYALMGIPAIVSRIAAHKAADIYPDTLYHSLLFITFNGVISYVGFRKPIYAYVGGLSVIFAMFFFSMGPSYFFEIPFLLYMIHNIIYRFSFTIFSEHHYTRIYRDKNRIIMICWIFLLLVLLLFLQLINWNKSLNMWDMMKTQQENFRKKG